MGLFSWLLGKRLTSAQQVRRHQRAITKVIRGLEREMTGLEQQEKKLIADIKKSAGCGNVGLCKIQARDLIRTRQHVKKFMLMKANLQCVSVRILTLQSQQAMGEAMVGVTVALRGMNRQMRLPHLQRIIREFEKQNHIMDVKGEMVNESVEEALGDEDPEPESEELVARVFDELGLQLQQDLPDLPGSQGKKVAVKTSVNAGVADKGVDDDELLARLQNLRRN